MSHRDALGVILFARPLLGRFTTVPCLCHLWTMAVTVLHWSPKALEIVYNLESRDLTYFISPFFLKFFRSRHDVLAFDLLHLVRQALFK